MARSPSGLPPGGSTAKRFDGVLSPDGNKRPKEVKKVEKLGDILKRHPNVKTDADGRMTIDMTPTPAGTARTLAYIVDSVRTMKHGKPKEALELVSEELMRLADRIEYLDKHLGHQSVKESDEELHLIDP